MIKGTEYEALLDSFAWKTPDAMYQPATHVFQQMNLILIGSVFQNSMKHQVLFEIWDALKIQDWQTDRPWQYKVSRIISYSKEGSCTQCVGRTLNLDQAKEMAIKFLFGSIHDHIVCSVCGQLRDTNYYTRDKLIARRICMTCDFWQEIVLAKNDLATVICNGFAYTINFNENVPSDCKGHAGRAFHIDWFDPDRKPTLTTNLWFRGRIPPEFIDQLPDNATLKSL